MKKLSFLLIALLFIVPRAEADIIFSDNFDSCSSNCTVTTSGPPSEGGWTWVTWYLTASYGGVTKPTAEITTPGRGGTGKSLKMWKSSGTGAAGGDYAGLNLTFPGGGRDHFFMRYYMKIPSAFQFTGSSGGTGFKQWRLGTTSSTQGYNEIYLNAYTYGTNWSIQDGGGWVTVLNSSEFNAIRDGQWHCIEWEIGISSNTLRLWIDGVQKYSTTSKAWHLQGTVSNMQHFFIGNTFDHAATWQSGWQAMEADDFVLSTTKVGLEGGTTDNSPPYVDTFSPSDGATGVLVGTTSASFHAKDSGTVVSGADIASLSVGGLGCASCGSCDAGLTCSGTSADYTITRTGLSLSYDQVWSEDISLSDLAGNAMATRTFNFTVQPDPQPTLIVTTTTLPGGTVGTAYSGGTLSATGGVSPYTWAVSAGSLPAGLSLSTGGVIGGNPTTSGTSNFTVQASDSDDPANTDTQALSIVIVPGTLVGGGTTQNANFADTIISPGGGEYTNYSTNTWLAAYQWPAYQIANRTIIMDNADILSIPLGVTITAAKLRLYLTGSEGGGTNPMRIYVYKITGSVPDTTTVTWDNFIGTLTQLGYTDVSLTLSWFEWDVLSAVQSAYASRSPLYLALDGGNLSLADSARYFASVDHATAAWRPQLVVTTQAPINLIPPAAPTGHSVSAGDNQVTLYHGASSGATQYNCYWTSNGSTPSKANGTKIAGIANAYVLTGLTDNVTYKFTFTATNADGESIESSVDTATPMAPPETPAVPSAPILHSVGAGNGYINLFPGTSSGATSYNAYYTTDGTTPTTGSTKITGATGGQRLTATNGVTYKFVFTAVNATGESIVSTVDTATPTANEGINFLTNTGNYITTIINGLKNYLQ